jgi:hypothetical protein
MQPMYRRTKKNYLEAYRFERKQLMDDYYQYRSETIKKDARLKAGNQIRNEW